MKWSKWMRQSHRWLSIVFTVTVVANIVAITLGSYPLWLAYVPLVPLLLQLVTGLFLFALPYVIKRRGRQLAAGEAG